MSDGSASETIVVVGAGTMGRGIAYVSAAVGELTTRLVDVAPEQLRSAQARIESDVDSGRERGRLSAFQADAARARLEFVPNLESACTGATLVIEAVVERMDVKHEVLGRAAQVAGRDCVIASNTSALSLTEIAAGVDTPERVLGLHFFNPVPRMKLCEIVRALQTSDETLGRARRLVERMGKDTVVVKDVPGFATSRINALIGNEAFRMLEEGVAEAHHIDLAVKLGLNHPMGPFEMVDLVGLDVRLAAGDS